MEIVKFLMDYVLHLDKHLGLVIQQYHSWTYLILFAIIFCETGLVVTPFLPGDSLLFTAGTLAAGGYMNVTVLFIILSAASIIGDNVNYLIGRFVGPKIFYKENVKFLNREHLEKTHRFYEKYGGKTIILAKYAPIIRTFAPFVAGIGKMTYIKFLAYDVVAALSWMSVFILGGFFFGNVPVVKNNFGIVIVAILVISLLPAAIEFIKHARSGKSGEKSQNPPAAKLMEEN